MRLAYTAGLAALAIVAAAALAPSSARAACGDLNNDGAVNLTDANILALCAVNCIGNEPCTAADCPAIPNLCGTGVLADCADIFGDGDTDDVVSLTADSGALNLFAAGIEPTYALCTGPGTVIACAGVPPSFTYGSSPGFPAVPPITTNTVWPTGCTVNIAGTLFVDTLVGNPTTVLTIQPGVTVKGVFGSPNTNPSALIFLVNNTDPNPANFRKSKIFALGSPSQPIVFTSSQPAGMRARGDWGGVMFNGLADVNGPGCKFQAEGIPTAFGGCKSTDSSGTAVYVRAEYAGVGFSVANELNVWTMNGIGSQTRFDFIQANDGLDDCHEWFGGTLHQDHLLASACGDDALDWQLGYTGSVQYALYVQNGTETDPSSDSRGIEADNSEFGLDNLPRSNPDFCNITLIGGRNQPGQNGGSDNGVLLRRGTDGQMANMIVTSFLDSGVELRDNKTSRRACVDADANRIPESLTGNLIMRNSIFYDNGSGAAGTATEHPLNSGTAGGNLDQNATACDLAACVDEVAEFDDTPPCNCDTETWYNLLVTGFAVTNACGSNATNPNVFGADHAAGGGDNDLYPPLDATENGACIGAGNPSLCCSGGGTGPCRELFDARIAPAGGTIPAVFNCNTLNPLFDNNTTANYLGAFNPAAACTTTGATAKCDWVEKPWASFAID